jgi:signal transduction histidine kinase
MTDPADAHATPEERVRLLEEENARLRGELREARQRKTEALFRLASGISHDINNHLTPVIAYSSMMREELSPSHPLQDYVQEIQSSAENTQKLLRLMQDIRAKGDFAGAVDVNHVIAEAVAESRNGLPPGIAIDMTLDPAAGVVRGDSLALRRVLLGFFKNAVMAMPGGGQIRVDSVARAITGAEEADGAEVPPGEYAIVTVCDQGSGMDERTRSRLYEPYFSTRADGESRGLGLALAYGLIRKCGGFLRCTSTLGAGTSFEIFLPRQKEG